MKRLYKKQAAISTFAQILECGGSTPLAYSTGKTRSSLRRLSHVHPWWGATLSQQHGFTLLEVLVSMVILGIIITLGTNIFATFSANSSDATDRAEMDTAGRGLLNFMATKLSHAVAGEKQPETDPPQFWEFHLKNGNEVEFVSVIGSKIQQNKFEYDSEWQAVIYNDNDQEPLMDNILDLKFYAYKTLDEMQTGHGDPWNCAMQDNLPYCFDIAVRLIGSRAGKRMQQLSGDDLEGFMERHSRWFTTRIYFQMREGFTADKAFDDEDEVN